MFFWQKVKRDGPLNFPLSPGRPNRCDISPDTYPDVSETLAGIFVGPSKGNWTRKKCDISAIVVRKIVQGLPL